VNGVGNQFLASTRFAVEQHSGIGGRYDYHLFQHLLNGWARSDDPFEAVVGHLQFRKKPLVPNARPFELDLLVEGLLDSQRKRPCSPSQSSYLESDLFGHEKGAFTRPQELWL
jgi:hypothetical protein